MIHDEFMIMNVSIHDPVFDVSSERHNVSIHDD